MPEMFCCTGRMRIDRNGVALVFHEQIEEAEGPVQWRAHQIFESDRYICPDCGHTICTGLGLKPVIERYPYGDQVRFDNYLDDLLNGRLTDMIGRPQPWVEIFE